MLLEKQIEFQTKLNSKFGKRVVNPSTVCTCGEGADLISMYASYILEECHELRTAFGGDSLGKAAEGVWKIHKDNYEQLRSKKLTEHTKEDLHAIKLEAADVFILALNMCITAGIHTTEELDCIVKEKIEKNLSRLKGVY